MKYSNIFFYITILLCIIILNLLRRRHTKIMLDKPGINKVAYVNGNKFIKFTAVVMCIIFIIQIINKNNK